MTTQVATSSDGTLRLIQVEVLYNTIGVQLLANYMAAAVLDGFKETRHYTHPIPQGEGLNPQIVHFVEFRKVVDAQTSTATY